MASTLFLRLAAFALALATAALLALPCAAQTRQSGAEFLTPQLLAMQTDADQNPATLWIEQGREQWRGQCQSCHADDSALNAATRFPVISGQGRLINLEDQINVCRQRIGQTAVSTEEPQTLALSAWLHSKAKGLPIQVQPPSAEASLPWHEALAKGAAQYTQRVGRMNLACVHCHDGKVGKNLRAEVISPAHPTGFPVYRLNWQTLGSIDRRLRACYSGVQASVPANGSTELRQLELFLKVRANGMPLDGPSVRR